ncbi:hypothetical protein HETIRDRAFT_325031 [Heterobasidion irregulare TC 32-1]|uniref:Uncharacterized protein n=1 Tax=Heterobasidion irregulare (strain TC 32-1) TaxID=747525 RepID=W4JXT4_HETIT|nr:uncharacterized protein HETIRDRAFT_325031 [Heterobasidion irregulare TC 32-1]ETW78382.1 hypothetical protein HETIRDRAFT_325031 [Heterobasidion irregulare TC 32-1]
MHACAMPATTSSTPAPPHAHSLCVRTPLPEAILTGYVVTATAALMTIDQQLSYRCKRNDDYDDALLCKWNIIKQPALMSLSEISAYSHTSEQLQLALVILSKTSTYSRMEAMLEVCDIPLSLFLFVDTATLNCLYFSESASRESSLYNTAQPISRPYTNKDKIDVKYDKDDKNHTNVCLTRQTRKET